MTEIIFIKNPADQHKSLKLGIWIYFILLIFEGALRKWVLPGLATPLLIVRDPVALWLIFTAIKEDLLPKNSYMTWMVAIGFISIFTAFFFGHGVLSIALYGARILLIHFPLIFVIGNILNQRDVEQIGKVLIFISLPMVVLLALQFYSPQSAWVNRGIGGDMNGAGFSGANGFFRPPGTFSFTNGNSMFFAFVASFLFYFWLNPEKIPKIILIAATVGLIASISLSISRTLLFSCIISALFAGFTMLSNPKLIIRFVLISIMAVLGISLLNQAKFFKTSTEAFTSRYTMANDAEGGVSGVIGGRAVGGMTGDLMHSIDVPFFGYGVGLGTNAGAMLLSGKQIYLISEGEWGRLIGEMGPLLGIIVIFIRFALVLKMGKLSITKLKTGDLLPWMLLSFGAVIIIQSQWAQPTNQGFSTLVAGLIIASLRSGKEDSQEI